MGTNWTQITDILGTWPATLRVCLHSCQDIRFKLIIYDASGWLAAFIIIIICGWPVFSKEWVANAFKICGGQCIWWGPPTWWIMEGTSSIICHRLIINERFKKLEPASANINPWTIKLTCPWSYKALASARFLPESTTHFFMHWLSTYYRSHMFQKLPCTYAYIH